MLRVKQHYIGKRMKNFASLCLRVALPRNRRDRRAISALKSVGNRFRSSGPPDCCVMPGPEPKPAFHLVTAANQAGWMGSGRSSGSHGPLQIVVLASLHGSVLLAALPSRQYLRCLISFEYVRQTTRELDAHHHNSAPESIPRITAGFSPATAVIMRNRKSVTATPVITRTARSKDASTCQVDSRRNV